MDIACRHCSRARAKPLRVRLFPLPSISPSTQSSILRHVHDFLPSDPTQSLAYFGTLTRGKRKGGGVKVGEIGVVSWETEDDTVVPCHVLL